VGGVTCERKSNLAWTPLTRVSGGPDKLENGDADTHAKKQGGQIRYLVT